MESEGTKKRRKVRFLPPARLKWGGESKGESRDTTLWVDKYAPQNTDELCVAPKKLIEVRSWIEKRSPSEKMLILVGNPGIGKSTMVKLLAKEFDLALHEWSDSYSSRGDNYERISVEQISPLRSFEEFLQRTGAGFRSLMRSGNRISDNKSIILLDELPNLHGSDAEANFRELLNQHLEVTNVPTVMIFSDVYEGQHKPADLERLIDPKYLYSNYVEIVRLHSVTKAKMKKACFTICKLEKIQPPDWEEFNLECNGDIRHAIMTLQLRGKNNVRNAQENRDIKLSTFHALGKILYAKRQKVSVENGERPPLEFNPEKVMEDSEMGLGGALTFLGYHCPEFFNDIVELSDAFDRFSDAANLLDLNIDSPTRQANAIFPNGYVASLAGRAIADANKHPASSTFRALSAPKVFEAYRKARANRLTMLQLCKRLTVGSGKLSLDTNIGGSRTFITDHLPLMKIILPNEINSALGTLYSFVIPNQSGRLSTTEDLDSKIMVEQAEILAEDDIVDDDDDSIDQVRFSTVAAIKITQSESDDGKETRAVAIPHDIIVIDD